MVESTTEQDIHIILIGNKNYGESRARSNNTGKTVDIEPAFKMIEAMKNFFAEDSVYAPDIQQKGGFKEFKLASDINDPYPFRIFKDATSELLNLELKRLDFMIL